MKSINENTSQKKSDVRKNKIINIIILIVALILIISYFTKSGKKDKKTISIKKEYRTKTKDSKQTGIHFVKEGELVFFNKEGSKKIKKIDIEIADNEQEKMQGLMYRKYMPDTCGMLFIFDKEEPQSFWMKNTIIPLDIIFVDKNGKIVSIQKNTTPYSEKSIPSYKPAMFVVEVNAGFCDRYDIKQGDYISF